MISRNSEASKRGCRSVYSVGSKCNSLAEIKAKPYQDTNKLVNLQEAKIFGTSAIESELALEIEQAKKCVNLILLQLCLLLVPSNSSHKIPKWELKCIKLILPQEYSIRPP